MNNLSFHITDITANSIRANASEIGLSVEEQDTCIVIRITDNGLGMDAETARRVTNPFYTTRTTRKVGLGLPFLIQNAEQTGGSVTLTPEPGKGTEVRAVFHSDHIDCPPWGDLPGTVALLITGNPEIYVCFEYRSGETGYSISTNEIKEILDGVPLSYPKVMLLIKEMIKGRLSFLKFILAFCYVSVIVLRLRRVSCWYHIDFIKDHKSFGTTLQYSIYKHYYIYYVF